MKLPICYFGNPVLRKKAKKIETFDDELKKLAEDMIETMLTADGVGLAAPQIGKSIQMVIVDPDPSTNGQTRIILINPEIEIIGSDKEVMEEGCLSIPGIYGHVKRPKSILVKAQDLEGKPMQFEAHGFFARVVQHETDHLKGTLFVDKILPRDKKRVEKELKEFQEDNA